MVLLLNHVLMQEPEAQARAGARPGASARMARWRMFSMRLAATPAGLLEVAPAAIRPT
jgi:ubiquinone biosynthesis protein UbiJ